MRYINLRLTYLLTYSNVSQLLSVFFLREIFLFEFRTDDSGTVSCQYVCLIVVNYVCI